MKETADYEHRVTDLMAASIFTKQSMLSNSDLVTTIAKVSEILQLTLRLGNKVVLFGNGGMLPTRSISPRNLLGASRSTDQPCLHWRFL